MRRKDHPSKGKIHRYQIEHMERPDLGKQTVDSIGPDSATVEAARRWGINWGKMRPILRSQSWGLPRAQDVSVATASLDEKATLEHFARTASGQMKFTGGSGRPSARQTAGPGNDKEGLLWQRANFAGRGLPLPLFFIPLVGTLRQSRWQRSSATSIASTRSGTKKTPRLWRTAARTVIWGS